MTDSKTARPVAIIVMGPSSVGKTTTAKLVAKALDWPFAEADEFHPPQNIDKMSAGIALNDTDRQPWLEKIRDWISSEAAEGRSVVLTCSALKRRYRDTLRGADARVRFLELVADKALVAARMAERKGHYMPPALLDSQFADLEMLDDDEDGVKIDVGRSPEQVRDDALAALGLDGR